MKKVIKTEKVTVEKEVTIDVCDSCGCEINNPAEYGAEHCTIILSRGRNFPEHSRDYDTLQLCDTCYEKIETAINNIIKLEKEGIEVDDSNILNG